MRLYEIIYYNTDSKKIRTEHMYFEDFVEAQNSARYRAWEGETIYAVVEDRPLSKIFQKDLDN